MSKAVVYSKNGCPWCVRAKDLLEKQGVPYEEHILGVSPKFQSKELLEAALGVEVRTVPQIVLDGQYIGGYSELAKHYGV